MNTIYIRIVLLLLFLFSVLMGICCVLFIILMAIDIVMSFNWGYDISSLILMTEVLIVSICVGTTSCYIRRILINKKT